MTEKEFRRLNRKQLVDVIFELQKQNKQCRDQLAEAQEKLQDRELKIAEAGSIAEAVLGLHDIFANAQAAADQYVEEVTRAHSRADIQAKETVCQAQEQAKAILEDAKRQAQAILEESKRQAQVTLDAANRNAATVTAKASAERDAVRRWTGLDI